MLDEEMVAKIGNEEAHVDATVFREDSLGVYLQEIGRVNLLKPCEERELARKIERAKHLEDLKQSCMLDENSPSAWELCWVLLRRMSHAARLVRSLLKNLGLSPPNNLTLCELAGHGRLRAGIDAVLDPKVIASVAQDMRIEEEEAKQRKGKTGAETKTLIAFSRGI